MPTDRLNLVLAADKARAGSHVASELRRKLRGLGVSQGRDASVILAVSTIKANLLDSGGKHFLSNRLADNLSRLGVSIGITATQVVGAILAPFIGRALDSTLLTTIASSPRLIEPLVTAARMAVVPSAWVICSKAKSAISVWPATDRVTSRPVTRRALLWSMTSSMTSPLTCPIENLP